MSLAYFRLTSLGYASADFWRYILSSTAAYDQVGIWTELHLLVQGGVLAGTFGPLAIVPLSIWATPLEQYAHALQVLGIVANMGTFYVLAWQLSRSNAWALLAVVIAICSVQFHILNDPYLSNLFVFPFAAEFVLLAMLAYVWNDERIPEFARRLAPAVLLAFASGIVPACALFVLPLGAYAWVTRPRRAAMLDSSVFAGLTFLALAVTRFRGFTLATWHGALGNFLGAIPVVYRATSGLVRDQLSGTDRNTSFDRVPSIDALGWMLALFCAGYLFWYLSRPRPQANVTSVLTLATGLWVCASFFRSGAPYFEAFALGLVGAAVLPMLVGIRSDVGRIGTALAAVAVLFVVYGNVRTNTLVVHAAGEPWDAFSTIRRGAQRHLFSVVPEGSSVAISSRSALRGLAPSAEAQKRLLFALSGKRFIPSKKDGGWLLRETIVPFTMRKIELLHLRISSGSLKTDRAEEYMEYLAQQDRSEFTLNLVLHSNGMKTKIRAIDDTHILVDVIRTCGPISPAKVMLPNATGHIWSNGFYPIVQPNPIALPQVRAEVFRDQFLKDPLWRYARRSADLIFTSDNCGKSLAVKVWMLMYSAFPGSVQISGAKVLKYSYTPSVATLIPAPSQSLKVSQTGVMALLELGIPNHGATTVHFKSLTPAAPIDTMLPRNEKAPITDIHLFAEIEDIQSTPQRVAPK